MAVINGTCLSDAGSVARAACLDTAPGFRHGAVPPSEFRVGCREVHQYRFRMSISGNASHLPSYRCNRPGCMKEDL
jgi:hypothetical protein